MPTRSVFIRAPSRLHFGLFSFGGGERQFGGVGAMIERPGLVLRAERSERFACEGPLADRVRLFADRWSQFHRLTERPACRVTVESAPPQHVGLGTGTQLGLSVAAALNAFSGRPQASPVELAASVGRAFRSAVGTYGFCGGGLIVERGKSPDEAVSPLDCRLDLPAAWRFLLVCPRELSGVSGGEEQRAFSSLPQVPRDVSNGLIELVRERMAPAAALGDFEQFSDSVYEFGHRAGLCFASQQGGPYNGPRLTAIVEQLRKHGIRGVGQSSWGPTIFALAPDAETAEGWLKTLASSGPLSDCELTVTPACNRGARLDLL